MEAASVAAFPLFAFSKTVKFNAKPQLCRRLLRQTLPPCRSFSAGRPRSFGSSIVHQRYRELLLFSYVGNVLQNAPIATGPGALACISSFPVAGAGGGGGGGEGGRGLGGGGGGGPGSGEGRAKSLAVEAEEGSSAGPDVILLDVGGMSCGGCAASVKRILESQPQVSSASVNLATETAIVWAVPKGEITHSWQKQLGEKLASQLTTCGFKSTIRDSARESWYRVFERKMDQKLQLLKESGIYLDLN